MADDSRRAILNLARRLANGSPLSPEEKRDLRAQFARLDGRCAEHDDCLSNAELGRACTAAQKRTAERG